MLQALILHVQLDLEAACVFPSKGAPSFGSERPHTRLFARTLLLIQETRMSGRGVPAAHQAAHQACAWSARVLPLRRPLLSDYEKVTCCCVSRALEMFPDSISEGLSSGKHF